MLDIVITLKDGNTKKVDFTDIKKMADDISKVIFMYECNSYVVDVEHKTFLINGGRYLTFDWLKKVDTVHLQCFRRNRKEFNINGSEIAGNNIVSVSYLLGFYGIIKAEKKEVYLHISEDGKAWHWLNKR